MMEHIRYVCTAVPCFTSFDTVMIATDDMIEKAGTRNIIIALNIYKKSIKCVHLRTIVKIKGKKHKAYKKNNEG